MRIPDWAYSRRGVFGVLLLLTLATVPFVFLSEPIKSVALNLLASWVVAAFTIFGLDVLLRGMQARARLPLERTLRAPLRLNITQLLNSVYRVAREPIEAAAGTKFGTGDVPLALARAWVDAPKRFDEALTNAPWAILDVLAVELTMRSDSLRDAFHLAGEVFPQRVVAQVGVALAAVAVVTEHADVVRERTAKGDQDIRLALRVMAVGTFSAAALRSLSAAYLDLDADDIAEGLAR